MNGTDTDESAAGASPAEVESYNAALGVYCVRWEEGGRTHRVWTPEPDSSRRNPEEVLAKLNADINEQRKASAEVKEAVRIYHIEKAGPFMLKTLDQIERLLVKPEITASDLAIMRDLVKQAITRAIVSLPPVEDGRVEPEAERHGASDRPKSVALVYLARGADEDWRSSFSRFTESYRRFPAGIDHRLYIVFKGFAGEKELGEGGALFSGLDYTAIHVEDNSFDIGAYMDASRQIAEDQICFLNTHSEILGPEWLARLAAQLDQPNVGMVGATGSFESLYSNDPVFPKFPNVHLRLNAFMIRRQDFLSICEGAQFRSKGEAWLFESGPAGISRQIMARGLSLLVVGRNGQGYSPDQWPASDTFRQSAQENLLIADNHTRYYDSITGKVRQAMAQWTWGEFLLMNIPHNQPEGSGRPSGKS